MGEWYNTLTARQQLYNTQPAEDAAVPHTADPSDRAGAMIDHSGDDASNGYSTPAAPVPYATQIPRLGSEP